MIKAFLRLLIQVMDHFDLFLLRDRQCLIEHIQHHHRKQARLKLIGL